MEVGHPVDDRHVNTGLNDGQRNLAHKLGQTEGGQPVMAELPLTVYHLDFLWDCNAWILSINDSL